MGRASLRVHPPRSPLTWRVFLAVGAVVLVVLATTLLLLSIAADRTADTSSARALDRATRLITVLLDGREQALTRGMQVFVANSPFRSLVLESRPEDLLDQAEQAAEQFGATWVQITDERGVRLAKSDEPTALRVPLSGSALIGGALEGEATTGFGASGDSILFQAVTVPIIGSARVDGVMMAVQVIDSALAAEVKNTTSSDIVFFVIDTAGRPHVAASTIPRDEALAELLVRFTRGLTSTSPESTAGGERGGGAAPADPVAQPVPPHVEAELAGEHYVGQGRALHSAGGDILGGFVALRSHDAEMAPYAALRRWIALAGLIGLAIAFALSYLTARSVARPVLALAAATRRAADGDYSAEVDVRSGDEIGSLADAVRTMLADLREKQALVDVVRAPRAAGEAATAMGAPSGAGSTSAAAAAAIAPGRVVAGRYAIAEELGAGGGGIVYRAFDRELGEVVALKTLRPEALADDTIALERLKSEIRLARRISHRNVVRTHDLGEAAGVYFITMEYVTGTSLRALIDRDGTLPIPAVFSIAKQLCRALEVAHEAGIVHRDIKPQNLMVQPDGTLKVMDFGVARLVQRVTALTEVGMVVGTPAYMAPEQLLDDPIDARADLYAAGVVLYECLTGRRPIDAESPTALIGRMLTVTPPPPADVDPRVPRPLSDVVMRSLAKEAADRPASAAEMYEMLVRAEG